MEPKTLRISLAMGGGVSLGSFSGSALTEALKLLIIYGKDEKGNPYKDIVVDGMSGASAGAIALTIMLRCLIDYKSMLFKWQPKSDEETDDSLAILARENRLESALSEMYFKTDNEMYETLSKSKIESLKALQLAQNIQEILWVDSVNAVKLYGDKINSNYKHKLDDSFGLLERKYMEGLVEKYLMGEAPDIKNIQVLDKKRVLFACSLTNILPMPINAGQDNRNILKRNVINSTGVFNHSEVRVIDFIFDEKVLLNKPSDDRWLKFMSNPDEDIPTEFNISSDKAWATISASALACGAFPIAFPPVLLKRYQEEYYLGIAKEKTLESFMSVNMKRNVISTEKGKIVSEWPKPFLNIQKEIKNIPNENYNSYFKDKAGDKLDYKSFNFPYVDGGTFNNEPIKEAYRIASFQEFKRRDTEQNERLVLFVDPIVRKEQFPDFGVSSFSPISGKKDTKSSTEINKFIASVSSLLVLLKNQGRIKEDDKIRDTAENLALKEVMFSYLEENENIKLTSDIFLKALEKIRTNLNENIISIGTRKPVEYFVEQLRKTSNGKWKGESFDVLIAKADSIEDDILQNNQDIDYIYNLFKIKNKLTSQNIFAITVFKVIADISLDTAGKNPDAINAAILPIDMDNSIIDLPGTEISAFAGFASKPSKQYAFNYAKLATLKALRADDGFRDKVERGGAYLKNNNEGDLDRIHNLFIKKVRDTKFFSSTNNYSQDLKTGLFAPSIQRIKRMIPVKIVKKIWNVPLSVASLALPILGIYGLISGLFSNVRGKRLSIKSLLTAKASDMADEVNYVTNKAVIINITGDKFNKPWYRIFSKKGKIKVKAILSDGTQVKIKAIREVDDSNKTKKEIKFYLFMPYHKVSSNKMTTLSKIQLFTKYRIPIPSKISQEYAELDPNLDKKWMEVLQENYPKEVVALKIDGMANTIKIDTAYVNNPERTLYHSLKNINIHVSPILEFDVSKKNENWYFKENTQSFDDELVKRKSLLI